MNIEQQNEQLRAQYKAVAHLSRAMATMCDELETAIGADAFQNIVLMQGERTHSWMEKLGDMLNSCDACGEDDEWIHTIFDNARKVFPLPSRSDCNAREARVVLHPTTEYV